MEKTITYCGQKMKVKCDEKCKKAFGRNDRPYVKLSANEDDWEWLADDELPEAPVDPSTYEDGEGKPTSSSQYGNKWCIRQCERCVASDMYEYDQPLELLNFNKRIRNIN